MPTGVLITADRGAANLVDDALDNARAGTASALMGTIQFVVGAVLILIVGSFLNGTALPMVAGIAGCATLALLFAQVTLRTETLTEPATEYE